MGEAEKKGFIATGSRCVLSFASFSRFRFRRARTASGLLRLYVAASIRASAKGGRGARSVGVTERLGGRWGERRGERARLVFLFCFVNTAPLCLSVNFAAAQFLPLKSQMLDRVLPPQPERSFPFTVSQRKRHLKWAQTGELIRKLRKCLAAIRTGFSSPGLGCWNQILACHRAQRKDQQGLV